MRILEWDDLSRNGIPKPQPAAVTIGVFDGVHIGHRALIEKIRSLSGDWERIVVTFRQNPKRLLHPESFHGAVLSLEQKLELLEAAGIATCVLIDFSGNFSKLTGIEFLSALARSGGARYLAVGADFRCGHRLSTDALGVRSIGESMGIETEIVEPVLYNGRPVSSSRIRRAVQEGRLPDAFAMLGRPFILDFRNLSPARQGGLLRFDGIRQVLPPPGEYEVEVVTDGNDERSGSLCVLSSESASLRASGDGVPRFIKFSAIREAKHRQGE